MIKKVNVIKKYLFPLPIRCIICDNSFLHKADSLVCNSCLENILSSKSKRYYSYISNNSSLSLRQEFDLDSADAFCLYPYDSPMQKMIKNLKFNYHKDLAYFIADNISYEISKFNIDGIVPLASSNYSLKERGFNQIEAIANELSIMINIPVLNCLKRTKNIRHQLGLSKKSRFENVKDTFICNENLNNKKLLLLDDVLTSGASTYFARKALIKSGAEVIVCAICKA